jgi:tight adherence protein C
VPDLFDYFVVSVQAGLPPAEALRHVLPVVHPLVAAALTDLDQRIDRGERLADALTVLIDRLGTRLAMFVSVIASCERTGLPLGPALERITDDARQHRRRLIEAEARELPVRLTIPLVTCTLPAFALVAIAPLVLGAVSTLTMS